MAADILIVDDEVDIRELVAGILEDEGYETRTAENSTTALPCRSDRVTVPPPVTGRVKSGAVSCASIIIWCL